jgi:hypothetical protein
MIFTSARTWNLSLDCVSGPPNASAFKSRKSDLLPIMIMPRAIQELR